MVKSRSSFGKLSILCIPLVVAVACDRSAEETPSPAVERAEAPAPAPKVEAPAGPVVTTSEFELRAIADDGGYTKGELAQFTVALTGRGGWHVNQEFPMSVEVRGSEALQFPKAALEKADAVEFTEEKARFAVPFTATGEGSHRVEAKVRFAVCTDENCIPEERSLALDLPVR